MIFDQSEMISFSSTISLAEIFSDSDSDWSNSDWMLVIEKRSNDSSENVSVDSIIEFANLDRFGNCSTDRPADRFFDCFFGLSKAKLIIILSKRRASFWWKCHLLFDFVIVKQKFQWWLKILCNFLWNFSVLDLQWFYFLKSSANVTLLTGFESVRYEKSAYAVILSIQRQHRETHLSKIP